MAKQNETQEIIEAVKSIVERRTAPAVVSVAEAARTLGVSKRTAQNLVAQGHLKRVVLPGRSRGYGVTRASLSSLLKTGGAK